MNLLTQAAAEAQSRGLLPPVAIPEPGLERPQNPEHGDYASNLALKLARSARMNPLVIANVLVDCLPPVDFVARVNAAPPGFINFTLNDGWLATQVDQIIQTADSFGSVDVGRGSTVQVEFVSANPVGPLHIGSGRGGVIGDTLASVLAKAGYRVEREYYVNDAGSRMDAFYQTLYARYLQVLGKEATVPEDGYHGQYMVELAKQMVAAVGDRYLQMPRERAAPELGQLGMLRIVEEARADLAAMGINYDTWFSEQSLYDRSLVSKVLEILRERGYVDVREGATWFASTVLGEDKDNVLVRSNGVPGYFASDIAYHYNKFVERGFAKVIDVWGADHQGHVPRMKAAVGALGIAPERLTVIIYQLVTLRRGQEIVRMSKRTGDIITLREVLEEVGADACRFFFLSRSADSQMDFDLELAKEQSEKNPVYYVQYAHARIASILRLAEERGINFFDGDVSLLTSEPELTLIRKMLQLPELVDQVAGSLAPHPLPYYAQDLAGVFHTFYKQCRVVSHDPAEEAITKARLKLVQAVKIVLANTLHLMGMTAPERM